MTNHPYRKFRLSTVFLLAASITMFLALCACGAKKPGDDKNLKRTVANLTKNFPEYDDVIVYENAGVEDDAIVVNCTLDKDFYASGAARGLQELWDNEEWKDEFKEKIIIRHSHLVKVALNAGIDICWRFYAEKPGDGFDLRINRGEIESIQNSLAQKMELSDKAEVELRRFVKKLNNSLPETLGNGITLREIIVNPNNVTYIHSVDENISSMKDAEIYMVNRNKGRMAQALNRGIAGDTLLMLAADAGAELIHSYKGTRTGYSIDYPVLTANELKNLRKDLR